MSHTPNEISKKEMQSVMRTEQAPWTPFVKVEVSDDSPYRTVAGKELYRNSLYQVIVSSQQPDAASLPPLIHLSIRRLDRSAVHDWRHLQRIKNELVGPQCEGIELYPSEDRLVDTTNQYHLWVFGTPGFHIGIGYQERLVAEGPYTSSAVQRPWPTSERPPDCLPASQLEERVRDERQTEAL